MDRLPPTHPPTTVPTPTPLSLRIPPTVWRRRPPVGLLIRKRLKWQPYHRAHVLHHMETFPPRHSLSVSPPPHPLFSSLSVSPPSLSFLRSHSVPLSPHPHPPPPPPRPSILKLLSLPLPVSPSPPPPRVWSTLSLLLPPPPPSVFSLSTIPLSSPPPPSLEFTVSPPPPPPVWFSLPSYLSPHPPPRVRSSLSPPPPCLIQSVWFSLSTIPLPPPQTPWLPPIFLPASPPPPPPPCVPNFISAYLIETCLWRDIFTFLIHFSVGLEPFPPLSNNNNNNRGLKWRVYH